MVIKYKTYTGVLIKAEQIQNENFNFVLDDFGVKISFTASIYEIRIVDCPGNAQLLSEIKR